MRRTRFYMNQTEAETCGNEWQRMGLDMHGVEKS
nr:MAG TPA: hypothetical protein [Caudoviricetes sp.]